MRKLFAKQTQCGRSEASKVLAGIICGGLAGPQKQAQIEPFFMAQTIYYRTVRNHYHARTAYAPSKISPAEYGAVAAARGYATLCLAQSAFCVVLHVVRLGSSLNSVFGGINQIFRITPSIS